MTNRITVVFEITTSHTTLAQNEMITDKLKHLFFDCKIISIKNERFNYEQSNN